MLSFLNLPAWGIALGGTIACAVLIHIGANMLFRAYDRRTGEQRQRVGEGLLKLIDSLHQNKADDLLVKDLIRRIERMEPNNPPRLHPFTDWLTKHGKDNEIST